MERASSFFKLVVLPPDAVVDGSLEQKTQFEF